jgi:hypothetical protein
MKPKNLLVSFKKRPLMSSLLQVGISVFIGILFVLYVGLIQVRYEDLLATQKHHDWRTALLFGLVIFGGSFSYDCAKNVLLLAPSTFSEFWKHLREALVYTVLMYVFLFVSAFLFSNDLTASGVIAYGAALFLVFSAVQSYTSAAEKVLKD